jgi:hypothetical protein
VTTSALGTWATILGATSVVSEALMAEGWGSAVKATRPLSMARPSNNDYLLMRCENEFHMSSSVNSSV